MFNQCKLIIDYFPKLLWDFHVWRWRLALCKEVKGEWGQDMFGALTESQYICIEYESVLAHFLAKIGNFFRVKVDRLYGQNSGTVSNFWTVWPVKTVTTVNPAFYMPINPAE